jgi:electron transfer flavoprotein beta subunit
MRILVQVKQILDPRGVTVNRRAGRVFVNREEYIANPADRHALEAALQLKDADPATEIYAMTAGPERCEAVLREALALGVDYAVRLVDPGTASDAAMRATVLMAAARRLGAFDLLLVGERALDSGRGEMGPRLAQAFGMPLVLRAYQLRLADGQLEAVVRRPHGFVWVRTSLPAVVTVARGANRPRFAHAPRLMRAYREWSIDYWDEAELGLDPAALAPRLTSGEPEAPPEAEHRRVSDIAELAALLRPFRPAETR